MKSKQLNFFITPDDKNNMESFFKYHDCLFIRNNIKSAKIDLDISFEKESIFQFFLSKENFKKEIFFKQIEDKSYYVDVIRSFVIEFDVGGFYPYSNKELHRGRFYCVTSFYNNGSVANKDGDFIKWIKKIFKLFPKEFLVKKNEYMVIIFLLMQ